MKLILEKSGFIYAYRETERHHKVAEKLRKASNLVKVNPELLAEECNLTHFPNNSYMVFNLKR